MLEIRFDVSHCADKYLRMRSVFVVFTSFTMLLSAGLLPVSAQVTGGRTGVSVVQVDTAQRLEQLFVELRKAKTEQSAQRVSNRIRQVWIQSGSASIDLMMEWAQQAIQQEKYDVALDFLDQVVLLQPDYPDGWNRRATVHYIMENYSKAMADIARTLELEPRHFIALNAMAAILTETGHAQPALNAYRRLLDVYPMQREAQREFGKLADQLAGQGT